MPRNDKCKTIRIKKTSRLIMYKIMNAKNVLYSNKRQPKDYKILTLAGTYIMCRGQSSLKASTLTFTCDSYVTVQHKNKLYKLV